MDKIDEALTIPQRMKRGQVMRKNKAKLKRARLIAQKRPADDAHIKKRAYIMARQIVRKRFAGKQGAKYEDLSPSEKINIDKRIDSKQALIKKIALRLMPRVKSADRKRLSTFLQGTQLQEPKPVTESILNAIFKEAFKDKDEKGKSPNIEILNKFGSKINDSLNKKAEKSGTCVESLREVFIRGLKSWNEDTNMSPEQYAFSRVNSFINGGKAVEEDADLATEQLKSYKVTTIHSVENNSPQSKKLTVHAKSSSAAHKLAKQIISTKYGGKVHDTDLVKEETDFKVGHTVYTKDRKREDTPASGKILKVGPNHVYISRGGKSGMYYKAHKSNVSHTKEDGWEHKRLEQAKKYYEDRKAGVKEEIELDEISISKMTQYIDKASPDFISGKYKGKKESNRLKGIDSAANKIYIKSKVNEEQLDEISDDMKDRYRLQAKMDRTIAKTTLKHDQAQKDAGADKDDIGKTFRDKQITQSKNILRKRSAGLKRFGEEVELDEGKMKELADDLKNLDHGNFKKKYGKAKHQLTDVLGKPLGFHEEVDLNEITIGRNIHLGFGAKGGVGYRGKVINVTDDEVHIQTPSGKTYRGPKKFASADPEADAATTHRNTQIMRKIIENHGNSQVNAEKRLQGTKDLVKAFKADTPGEVAEDVNTAERAPVVVPAHKDQYGNDLPAKTVMRKKNEKIIKSGNVHDGKIK